MVIRDRNNDRLSVETVEIEKNGEENFDYEKNDRKELLTKP